MSLPERDLAPRFVVFEGGEGSGKSTQSARLAAHLRAAGEEVVLTREPGGTPLGTVLREALLRRPDSDAAPVDPRTEALLYAADRAQHVAEVIRPALERGAVVVSDRYVDSSLAYQGAGRELPVRMVAELSAWATGGLTPGLTVLLDVDPSVGLRRASQVEEPDRIETEPSQFHAAVAQGFRDLAAAEPERYLVLDATRPADELAEDVASAVADVLGVVPR
jgi:dTMP kinase